MYLIVGGLMQFFENFTTLLDTHPPSSCVREIFQFYIFLRMPCNFRCIFWVFFTFWGNIFQHPFYHDHPLMISENLATPKTSPLVIEASPTILRTWVCQQGNFVKVNSKKFVLFWLVKLSPAEGFPFFKGTFNTPAIIHIRKSAPFDTIFWR